MPSIFWAQRIYLKYINFFNHFPVCHCSIGHNIDVRIWNRRYAPYILSCTIFGNNKYSLFLSYMRPRKLNKEISKLFKTEVWFGRDQVWSYSYILTKKKNPIKKGSNFLKFRLRGDYKMKCCQIFENSFLMKKIKLFDKKFQKLFLKIWNNSIPMFVLFFKIIF